MLARLIQCYYTNTVTDYKTKRILHHAIEHPVAKTLSLNATKQQNHTRQLCVSNLVATVWGPPYSWFHHASKYFWPCSVLSR